MPPWNPGLCAKKVWLLMTASELSWRFKGAWGDAAKPLNISHVRTRRRRASGSPFLFQRADCWVSFTLWRDWFSVSKCHTHSGAQPRHIPCVQILISWYNCAIMRLLHHKKSRLFFFLLHYPFVLFWLSPGFAGSYMIRGDRAAKWNPL